jgi:hypothetical protein
MARLKLGKPDVSPDDPSHVKGINQGNSTGNYESQAGHLKDGRSTAARSTGVNPDAADPVDPRMPNLSPP